jgi:hypothetical protein
MNWYVGVVVDGSDKREGYLSMASFISVAGALVQVQEHAPQRHCQSDSPRLWVLYVASCDGLQNV